MEQLSPQALLQLAQYQPCRNQGSTRDATFEHMVPAVLMDSGGSLPGPARIREAFLALFGVEIEQTEVLAWLENLSRRGEIQRSQGMITVSEETRRSLEARRREFEGLAATAGDEWRAWLLGVDPNVDDGDLDTLWEDLDRLIGVMVAYHGAEAAVILYPEEPRSEVLRETLHRQVDVLPKRGARLEELRREGLIQFFSAPTESQRRYLADRLDHGFFATVGTLRPSAAGVMREELSGQRLYLDTNVLIPALRFAGKRIDTPTQRLLELTRGLGVELAVTSRTIKEYQHSLMSRRGELEEDLPGRRFAKVMRDEVRRNGGINLAEGFYESYERTGASVPDWFRKASIVAPRLEELEIKVIDDGLTAVMRNEDKRIDAFMELFDREALKWRKERVDPTMQHDVIHRILVERLRGDSQRSFGSAKYWFLTEDKLLPHFGHLPLPGEEAPEIPFCISGSAWAQIARCFTPRTADYDQMVTDLLASPYLSFGRSHSLGEVQQVVNRITTLLDDASPAIVAAFVGDEVLQAVAGARDQEEKDEVLVDAYEHKKDEMQEDVVALTTRIEEMEKKLEASQAEAEDAVRLRELLMAAEGQLEGMKQDLQRQKALDAAEIKALKEQREADAEARERETGEARVAREKWRRGVKRRVGIGASILALAVLAALTIADRLSLGVFLLGGGLVLALVLARVVDNPRRAARAGFVLAVLGVLLSIVQLID